MARLVALDLAGGPAFVDELRRAWGDGDAVTVIPRGLPDAARAALLRELRPHEIVDGSGRRRHDPGAPLLADGDALVVATSGSTGRPKALVHTIGSLSAHAAAVHERLEVDPASDRWLACLPLQHLGGFGVVARAVLTGTPLTVVDGPDPVLVERGGPDSATLTSLVPTVLDRVDARRYRWVVLGGSADRGERPGNVVRTYGLTESGGGVVYDGVPLTGVEVRLDAEGAIALRGPTVARGRRGDDGLVVPITDADGWLATGDLGAWAPDGRLVVTGRADDLIVTGGENVWPEPVERVLEQHPAVREALVIGEPDPEWGQRVAAIVVPTDPSAPPTLEALRAHVKRSLPAPSAPRALHLSESLERTSLGKKQRPRPGH